MSKNFQRMRARIGIMTVGHESYWELREGRRVPTFVEQ